jgi:hypothetical protein
MSSTPPPPYSFNADNSFKVPLDFQLPSGTGFPPPPQFNVHPNQPIPQPPPIVVHRIVQARTAIFGPLPVELDCPYCHVTFLPLTFRFIFI